MEITQNNPQNRDSAIFYRSFYEAIISLPAENQLEIYNAIFELSFNMQGIELTGISKSMFTLIKPQIEANIKRYINGTKAKSKQDRSKPKAKNKQNGSKDEANKNVNKNNNDNENPNDNHNLNDNENKVQEIVEYYNLINNTKSIGAKEVVIGLKEILKTYSNDDIKKVICWMALPGSWYIEKGQNTLSVLSRSTKFYEKLERATAPQSKKPFDVKDALKNISTKIYEGEF